MLCFVRRLLLFAHEQPIFGCSFGLLSQFARGLALCPAAATNFLAGVAPYLHASVLNLRVSGGAIPATGGISSLADEACGGRAWIGMLATIECSGHLPEPA